MSRKKGEHMEKITLFHGTPSRIVMPTYGLGEKKHDYGMGFYLTDNLNLAKEWAVCKPNDENGWVHQYELDTDQLKILDFQEKDVLSWLAELMKHRDASDSKRYRVLSKKFIEKYGIDTEGYDVIKGWRANASYFYIAKEFVRDNIDMDILTELLSLGGLGTNIASSPGWHMNICRKSRTVCCLLIIWNSEKNIISEMFQQDKRCGN